jgi:hypothetical protein
VTLIRVTAVAQTLFAVVIAVFRESSVAVTPVVRQATRVSKVFVARPIQPRYATASAVMVFAIKTAIVVIPLLGDAREATSAVRHSISVAELLAVDSTRFVTTGPVVRKTEYAAEVVVLPASSVILELKRVPPREVVWRGSIVA